MARRGAFFICGVVAVLIGRVYSELQRFAPTQEIAWWPFSYVFLIVGAIAVCISFLPTAWVQGVGTEPTRVGHFTPLRFLLSFAALGLVSVVVFGILSPGPTRLPIPLVYSLCPACVLTITVDPSWPAVAFVLAPLNALVFGAIGGVIGEAISIVIR